MIRTPIKRLHEDESTPAVRLRHRPVDLLLRSRRRRCVCAWERQIIVPCAVGVEVVRDGVADFEPGVVHAVVEVGPCELQCLRALVVAEGIEVVLCSAQAGEKR